MAVDSVAGGNQSGLVWAFDAASPGPNLPPSGSSLFDYLFLGGLDGSRTVPYPFEALRQRIRLHTQGDGDNEVGLKQTLIPFSRALPRMAAAPEFYRFPRIVLAVDSDFLSSMRAQGPLLKDRLYIGYQEKAESLEVISYNEVAGRFEFQIVSDYAANKTPRVIYAERRLCVSCHQNGGPIFSEPLWRETNANPEIGRRIQKEVHSFHGAPSYSGQQTINQPRAISDAVARANLFSAYQQIWRKGCANRFRESRAIACRAAMLTAALQYRLSGARHFDTTSARYHQDFVALLRQNWLRYWPNGLSIPDPLIPDRDPLVTGAAVSNAFDPLRLRPSLQLWSEDEPGVIEAVIRGLSQFISNNDARRLDALLFAAVSLPGVARRRWEFPCALSRRGDDGWPQRIVFRCEQQGLDPIFATGYFFIDKNGGIRGETRGFRLGDRADFEELSLSANTASAGQAVSLTPLVKRTGLHPRMPDGAAIESIDLSWEAIVEEDFGPADEFPVYADNGRMLVTLAQDFTPVEFAIDELGREASDIFSDRPFHRGAVIGSLLQRMGESGALPCCSLEEDIPAFLVEAPVLQVTPEAGEADTAAVVGQAFDVYCKTCHGSSEPFPANFLRSDSGPFGEAIIQCAERIAYRLGMWGLAGEARNKTPMPPHSFLKGFALSIPDWRGSEAFAELRGHMSRLLAISGSSLKQVAITGGRAYRDLRPCLVDPE